MLALGAAQDALGSAMSAYVQSEYQEMVEPEGLAMLAAEGMPLPLKLIRPDGAMIDVELSVAAAQPDMDAEFVVEARDITKFIRAAEETRDREATLRGILSTLSDSVITIDERGVIQSANPATETVFGYKVREVIGKNVGILMPESEDDHHDDYISEHLRTGEGRVIGQVVEREARHKEGHTFPIDISVTKLRRGEHWLFIGVIRDITERKEAERRIHHMAHHDSLTGLPNRNLLDDRLERALLRVRRAHEQMALMYIDLDKFKPINDTLGHDAGDVVLKTVAKRMQSCLRKSDTVARVGGDEFVIILESPGGIVDPKTVSDKLLEEVPKPIPVGDKVCAVGCSIGIAMFPDDADNLHDLSRCADEAMYAVKEAGRNHYVFFNTLKERRR